MALFGKDRDRIERARGVTTDGLVSPVTSAAPPEVEMIEREREGGSSGDVGGTSAFLGKGSRVTGKLVFEGTVRIEGHVEGEISAQDTLIIGESAEVNAQITGSSVVVHGRVTGGRRRYPPANYPRPRQALRQHHDSVPRDPRGGRVRGAVYDGRCRHPAGGPRPESRLLPQGGTAR